jgi:hypothetical protein
LWGSGTLDRRGFEASSSTNLRADAKVLYVYNSQGVAIVASIAIVAIAVTPPRQSFNQNQKRGTPYWNELN